MAKLAVIVPIVGSASSLRYVALFNQLGNWERNGMERLRGGGHVWNGGMKRNGREERRKKFCPSVYWWPKEFPWLATKQEQRDCLETERFLLCYFLFVGTNASGELFCQ